MMHDHKVEEVNEILRMIEGAAKNNILVIATTNRREALDPALLRKGRFDHAIEVGYPTAEEVCAALTAMLKDRPHHNIQNLDQIASGLAGRPMSDSAWVINEAARLAARGRKDAIDEIDLSSESCRLSSGRSSHKPLNCWQRSTPQKGSAIFDFASRAGLTPSPTCLPGQGGSRKGMRPSSATKRVAREPALLGQTDGGFFNVRGSRNRSDPA
jgi:SpoVK/Ycf46/Vps4 family AAA+-type ATPase